jgi:hypothetical protein
VAHLTQYSNNVPIIQFNIDQLFMTIGQDFEMDICIPEDGVASNHASIEVLKKSESYSFIIKSREDELLIELNGETVSQAELQDGDWLIIGGVEFQFTDDGVNEIEEQAVANFATVTEIKPKLSQVVEVAKVETVNKESKPVEKLKVEVEVEDKSMTTKEFIANSRNSGRRRMSF